MIKANPCKPNVRLNGTLTFVHLKELKFYTLDMIAPWVQYSPLPVLKSHMDDIFGLWGDFCERTVIDQELKGIKRAQMTREMNKIGRLRLQWGAVNTREKFVTKFYQTILTLDGLSENRAGTSRNFH